MNLLVEHLFSGFFTQVGLVPVASDKNKNGCGFMMVPAPSIGEGYLLTYPVNPFCSITIYHLTFHKAIHYRYHHPAMLTISLSSPAVAKVVNDTDFQIAEQLLGYFLPDGEHECTLSPHCSIDSVGISFLPEFYEKRLSEFYERDFSDFPQIVEQINGNIKIPIVSSILREIASYTPITGTSELYYEAKILELIAELIEWHIRDSHSVSIKSIGDSDMEAIHRLSHFLQQHYCDALDVRSLARMCFMSKSKLSDLFRSIYGTTIVEFIKDLRVERAKDLLANSSYTIKEISSIVGYAQQSSFTYVFKGKTNTTPKEYRKMAQRK